MARDLLKAASLLSLLFAALYAAFAALAPWLHGFTPPTDPALVNRWYRKWVAESDGIETQAMLVGVTAFLGLGWLVASRLRRIPWPASRQLQALCLVPGLAIVAGVRTMNFTPLAGVPANLAVAGGMLALLCAGWLGCRLAGPRPLLRALLLCGSWLALSALVLLGAEPGDTGDYGFFIGPALKLAAGEWLGTFYIQYNLVGTLLFRAMIGLRLLAHQMQAVLGLVFVLWLWMYWRLARELLEDRLLVFLFVLALVVVRFLAIVGGPAAYPQVSPLRMDLWVPLALAAARFGIKSPWTSAAFALVYVADNVFGFLFAIVYALALAAELVSELRAGGTLRAGTLLGLGAPLAAALAFQLVTFGSPTNPAAMTYASLHLGFLPIGLRSMFWAVAWLLLLATYPIARDPLPGRRRRGLLLYGFAAAQLVYFYGRSHDYNLLNVSGIWLLIVFVGLDRLRVCGVSARVPAVAGGLFVLVASLAAAGSAVPKLELVRSRLARGVLLEPFARDLEIDRAPDLFAGYPDKQRICLFSENDAWYDYRYGLPQLGYFSPLQASVLADRTATELRERIEKGYTVVLFGAAPEDLTDLNATRSMTEARLRFVLVHAGGPLFDVRLEPRDR